MLLGASEFTSAHAAWTPPWGAPVATAHETRDPYKQIDLEYVSPSSLETFDEAIGGCEAKWGFSKLDGAEKSGSAATVLGSATHAQHEAWLRDGTPYDLTSKAGELALATSHLLPERDTFGLRVEQELRVQHPSLPGVWFGGKIDLNWAIPRADLATDESHALRDGHWLLRVVLDHKTTGDIGYAKLTREALLTHPQAPMYATFFFIGHGQQRHEYPGGKREWSDWHIDAADPDLELRWNYVTTKGRATPYHSWHRVTRSEIEHAFEAHVLRPARRMLEIVNEANTRRARGEIFGANQLRKNLLACPNFGGCPFKDRCGITPTKEIVSMSQPQDPAQEFLNRMTQAQQGPGGPPQNGAPTQGWSPPQQAAPAQPAPGGYGWQNNVPAQPQATMPAPQNYGPQVPPPAQGVPQYAGQPPAQFQGAPPPQYPGQPPAQPGYGGAINPPESGLVQQGPPAQGPGAVEPVAQAKRGRGRPKAQPDVPANTPTTSQARIEEAHNDRVDFRRESFKDEANVAVLAAIAAEWAKTGAIAGQPCPPSAIADITDMVVSRALELRGPSR